MNKKLGVDSVTKEVKGYVLLIAVMVVLLIVYMIYVILDERKKIKYYKSTIYYETDWDKYNDMVRKQKRIIHNKKVQLFILQVLVFLKGLVVWK